MTEPTSRSRTAQRDQQIWADYLAGQTQDQIAERYGLAQSTVSDIVRRVATDVPLEERRARVLRALAELDEARDIAMGIARREGARPAELPLLAIDRLVAIQQREAKALGTDAVTRVSVDAENLGAEILGLLGKFGTAGESGE